MSMRMNRRMLRRWRDMRLDETLPHVVLQPRLAALIHAPFTRREGCLIFGSMATTNLTLKDHLNRIEFQIAVNDVHLTDYIDAPAPLISLLQQGVKAAMELAWRLQDEGDYQVVLSFQYDDYMGGNLRFYECRSGERGIADDIEEYELNDVLVIDT
jgi:hypothetical protein